MGEFVVAHKVALLLIGALFGGLVLFHRKAGAATLDNGVPVSPYAANAPNSGDGGFSLTPFLPSGPAGAVLDPSPGASVGGDSSGPTADPAPAAFDNTVTTDYGGQEVPPPVFYPVAATTDNTNPWAQPAIVSGGQTNQDLPADMQLAGVAPNAYVIGGPSQVAAPVPFGGGGSYTDLIGGGLPTLSTGPGPAPALSLPIVSTDTSTRIAPTGGRAAA